MDMRRVNRNNHKENHSSFNFSVNASITNEAMKEMKEVSLAGMDMLGKFQVTDLVECGHSPKKLNTEVITAWLECDDDDSSHAEHSECSTEEKMNDSAKLSLIDSLEPYKGYFDVWFDMCKIPLFKYLVKYIEDKYGDDTSTFFKLFVTVMFPELRLLFNTQFGQGPSKPEPEPKPEPKPEHVSPYFTCKDMGNVNKTTIEDDEDDEDEVPPSSDVTTVVNEGSRPSPFSATEGDTLSKLIQDNVGENELLLRSLGVSPELQQTLIRDLSNMIMNPTPNEVGMPNLDNVHMMNSLASMLGKIVNRCSDNSEEVYDPTSDEIEV
jgi:hypothetical protein